MFTYICLSYFHIGCEILNEHLPPDSHLTNIDHVLSLMDLKGSGSVDLNAFFEVFPCCFDALEASVICLCCM